MNNLLANLSYYIPELIAVATMMALLFMEATYRKSTGRKFVFISGYIGLFCCLIASFLNLGVYKPLFTNAVIIDPFSTWIKIVMILGTLVSAHLAKISREIPLNLKTEFFILSTGVLIGGMLLASANNMLTVYLGVETLSILSYVMASLRKNDEKSSEAGLKYVLYGGVSAAVMLFGIGHIYGVLGSIHFFEMSSKLTQLSSMEIYVLLPAFLLFFAGLGYKIACVPFHMWSPDVYEGSPTPVSMFFSIVPKVAGIAALVRVSYLFFNQEGILQTSWVGLLQVVAAITMTLGNISAIGQRSVKRMLAWSSISHIGVILL
ncbi:MAG: NADH-quinone oxidoreductase subunit N, partial [Halobacteriovoraceae bacterium]|nr:NADH-quinone oxidoreductase subunit N [Halobacteriovoraceae bacterium]